MSKYAFGVDVGGTTVKLGLFNDEGQVLDKWEIPTVKDNGGEKVLPDIAASIKNKMQEKNITAADLVGVGIGAPGAVNAEGFMVNGAVNIGWGSFDLAETLKKELDLPVTVKAGNDANVAALGEMWQGGGKGYSNLVAVTLGTGVGGGIIIDGRIYTGFNYCGAELGHTVVHYGGRPCNCGRKGCFEAYSSATALINMTKEAMEADKSSKMWEICSGDINNVDGKTAFDGWRAGDKSASGVVDMYISYLGCGLTNIVNTFQPEILLIGGGICKEGDNLTKPLEKIIAEDSYCVDPKRSTKLGICQLGNDAGIIGAAFLYTLAE